MLVLEALESLGPEGVAELLRLRPDLHGPSSSLRDLGARAVHPASLSIALRSFDTPTLQVAEVLAALGTCADRPTLEALLGIPPGAPGDVPRAALDRSLVTLRRTLFLQVHDEPRLLPEIARAWPEPLGLGPSVADMLPQLPVTSLRAGLTALGIRTKKTLKADLVEVLIDALSDADLVRATVEQAPPAIAARVRRAAFGEPLPVHYLLSPYSTGIYGGKGVDRDPTLWALSRLLAVQTYDGVVVPAEVAMALRGPRWHVPFAHEAPPVRWGPPRPAGAQDAAAAGQAVRTVTGLVEALTGRPLQRIKSGAVGVRELRRLAKDQGVAVPEVRLGLSLAHQARLLTSTPAGIGVNTSARTWLRRSPAARAADLMSGWLHLPELPTLEAEGPWAPDVSQRLLDLKTVVLAALAACPQQPPEPESFVRRLTWAHPVTIGNRISALPPHEHADTSDDVGRTRGSVEAVLAEAALVGVVADGALTQLGSKLIAGQPAQVESVLDAALGAAATTARLQADLTAVVLGHPAADLSATLDALADRESRSAATTWRFSPVTVRRALDAGWDADTVLRRLAAVAEGPVPQPLTYLVNDVARRHGHLRGGTVMCYLRATDAALVREVVADRRLAALGLRAVADVVLVGDRPLDETLQALRAAGYAPVEEGRDGSRVVRRK